MTLIARVSTQHHIPTLTEKLGDIRKIILPIETMLEPLHPPLPGMEDRENVAM